MVYVAKEHKIYVLNASGMAPTGATVERFNKLGYAWNPKNWGPGSGMPAGGILPVTVPGAVWGWQAVLKRFGKLTFKEVLEPAAEYAQDGFPVSERIAHDWRLPNALPLQACCTQAGSRFDQDLVRERRAAAARTDFQESRSLANTAPAAVKGRDAFYKGEIAQAIVAKSRALGGLMTLEDLAKLQGRMGRARAHQLPWLRHPRIAAAGASVGGGGDSQHPGRLRAAVDDRTDPGLARTDEPRILAFADRGEEARVRRSCTNTTPIRISRACRCANCCPRNMPLRCAAKWIRGMPRRPAPPGNFSMPGDTIVLSTADADGNMVSWVNSNFSAFGSGLTVPGYGFILHNRGALFTLNPKSPNAIEPHKRPFNTLSAGFVMHNDQPLMTVTLDGRRHAGAGTCAVAGRYIGSGRQLAGRRGYGAIPAFPGIEYAELGDAAV